MFWILKGERRKLMSRTIFERDASEFDWVAEMGINIETLYLEAFWHPVAQWENARIQKQGDDYWAWRRLQTPEPPTVVARMEAKPRPMLDFTERQMNLGMRLLASKV